MEKSLDDFCSTRDIAKHYDVSLQTVQQAVRAGHITSFVKVLGRIYFDKEKVIEEWKPATVVLRETGVVKGAAQKGRKPGFQKGNTVGVGRSPGRPSRVVEAKYLRALSDAITPDDWLAIIQKAIEQAKTGDWRARNWLSNYLMGTPIQRIAAEVDIVNRRDFTAAERAAAVMALLGEVRKREEAKIIDVTPNEKQD